ncbi:MAG: DUF3552 domain-containing protein, partial [Oscillochloris sp.]|nr:DUF3552 domain-containing protein [Oscillochloris sp.]
MIDLLWAVLGLVIGLVIGAGIGVWWVNNGVNSQMQNKAAEARLLLEEARSQQKEILLQAKDDALRIRNDAEAEIRESRQSIQKQEERLQRKEENLDRKLEGLERRDRQVQSRERQIEQLYQEAERVKNQQVGELERISQLNREEAREIILTQVEREARDEAARRIREIEQSARNEAEKNARKIIGLAVQRCASDYVAELTVTTVNLPSEELKGRIIGREGRNIRAFEQITGVDIIVDDTPEAVTLSCHDPVRREVARVSLSRLLKDGRIHPTRIEEIVQKTQVEIEHVMREEGERVAYEANVQGLHPDLIKLLGRLKLVSLGRGDHSALLA